jgi:hypothetical protein
VWCTQALLVVAGCGGSEEEAGPDAAALSCFVGDPAQPPEIGVVYRAADGAIRPVAEQGEVPLIQPPQGGKVMFIGIRGRNLDGCPLDISAALIEPSSGAVISLERRPVLLQEDGTGWLEPRSSGGLSNYSNLPGCPRAALARSINDETYRLLVSVEDQTGLHAETETLIVPVCGEPERDAQCRCECSEEYELGDSCEPEAGVGP